MTDNSNHSVKEQAKIDFADAVYDAVMTQARNAGGGDPKPGKYPLTFEMVQKAPKSEDEAFVPVLCCVVLGNDEVCKQC